MPEKHITIYDRITPPVKKKVPKSIRKDIDRIIKETWKKNMHKDYYDCNMLKEDSMKCCFYYHLRRKLSTILKKYNLRIFTEYYVSERECKIVCVKRNCTNLLYAPYWGNQS